MHASYEARLKSPTKRLQVLDRSPSKHSRLHGRTEDIGERFLPMRGIGLPLPFESLHEQGQEKGQAEEEAIEVPSRSKDLYDKVVEKELLGGNQGQRVLGKRVDTPERDSPFSLSPLSTGTQQLLSSRPPEERSIPRDPYKVLDAPGIYDDFYYSVLDWGVGNRLAVGLDCSLFLCNLSGGAVTQLGYAVGRLSRVTCVKFQHHAPKLGVARDDGSVAIFDVDSCQQLQWWRLSDYRIGAMHWKGSEVAVGCRDRTVVRRDMRDPSSAVTLRGHTQEVCSVRWSPDGVHLASGSNDNTVMIWDSRMHQAPLFQLHHHTAAIRALAWSPVQRGLLATGGGTADRGIAFTNALTGTMLSKIDTGSQISNLEWSPSGRELVTSHGFSLKGLIVWRYEDMKRLAVLTGHSARVLYMAPSPDGRSVATGSGDESIRLWNVFSEEPLHNHGESSLRAGNIR